MAKELPYLQWEPALWMFGKIQRCSRAAKGAFADMISRYWNALGEYSLEDAKMDCGEDEVQELIDKKVVSVKDAKICIKFCDEQILERTLDKQRSSDSGKLGNIKRYKPAIYAKILNKEITFEEGLRQFNSDQDAITPLSPPDRESSQIRIEEIRVDEIRVYFLNSERKISIIKNLKSNSNIEIGVDELDEWFEKFFDKLKAEDQLNQTNRDLIQWFNNWIKTNYKINDNVDIISHV